ncbi:hypothetical protein DFH01_22650 [Falsiroseomonas bella]|uniref:PEP-CTERM protein-sorting domain-containing protein n=1 Tax=Falsiroseomonas bella TaxID=2184016 RepID=A0A317FB32_9PROT|nr:hypothetical protein DFH01_22650 [Falsiroseomonas bella]
MFGDANISPAVTCCTFGINNQSAPNFATGNSSTPTITFTRVQAPVGVPEPATALILGPALLLGGLALRRRHAAG